LLLQLVDFSSNMRLYITIAILTVSLIVLNDLAPNNAWKGL
jgi:hypothetical protein